MGRKKLPVGIDSFEKMSSGEVSAGGALYGNEGVVRWIAGEAIEKSVRLELTCNEIDKSIDNLWNVLFTTGYLTQAQRVERGHTGWSSQTAK